MSDFNLDRAYSIDGADDAKKLYGSWAETYDTDFGAALGYAAPRLIAETFLAEGGAAGGPVLDIGAGTGLVAENLPGLTVDGIDIAPEMLEEAGQKGLYRNRIVADVLAPLDIPDASYGGFVSAGTFTHGHVGPQCLPELLRIARPDALFACGVIGAVYDGMGFGSTLARLVAKGEIGPLRFVEIDIYDKADHSHGKDKGLVMIFRKSR